MPSWKRRITGAAAITRPGNVALTLVSVIIGGACADAPWGWPLALLSVSAGLIAAGGYAINDRFDLEIDRVNEPGRPLPRGDISPAQAGWWAALLTGLGLALAWLAGWLAGCIASFVALSLYIYAARMKRTVLIGHFIIAVLSGVTFVYGGLAGERLRATLVPAVLAGAFHLGRELFKAAADRDGDRLGGANTVAVRWGVPLTCRLAVLPLIAAVVLSPLPVMWGWFGVFYLVAVAGGVVPVLLYATYRAWKSPDARTAAHLARILKWDMIVGLIAVGGDRWLMSAPLMGH